MAVRDWHPTPLNTEQLAKLAPRRWEPLRVDQRQHQRWQPGAQTGFNFDGVATGTILNIGEGGMQVMTDLPLLLGRSGVVSFALAATDANFECRGEVLWSDHSGRAGLRFVDFPASLRPKLASWLLQSSAKSQNDPPAASSADVSLLRMLIPPDEVTQKRVARLSDWLVTVWMLAFIVAAGVLWFRGQTSEHRTRAAARAPERTLAAANESISNNNEVPNAAADAALHASNSLAATKRESAPLITRITYWSEGSSTYVAIQLDAAVKFQAHRLHRPERIYVDIEGSGIAPGLRNQTLPSTDSALLGIRIGHPKPGFTRVVLETARALDYSTAQVAEPYRLVIAMRPSIEAQRALTTRASVSNSSQHRPGR